MYIVDADVDKVVVSISMGGGWVIKTAFRS